MLFLAFTLNLGISGRRCREERLLSIRFCFITLNHDKLAIPFFLLRQSILKKCEFLYLVHTVLDFLFSPAILADAALVHSPNGDGRLKTFLVVSDLERSWEGKVNRIV